MHHMRHLFIILLAVVGGACHAEGSSDHNFAAGRGLETFSEIYKQLDLMYVDTLNADETIGTGIRAMLRSLDPYTEYYPASETKNLRSMITGKYAGIGAVIRKDLSTGNIVIDEPYEGMPAAEAGLRKGDEIVSVDDTLMTGREVSEVSQRLRGEPGTTFALKIRRLGKQQKLRVTRRAIQLPSVPCYTLLDDTTGYVALSQFTDNCSRDMRRAVVSLRQQGMRRMVLDLRGNGGGSLEEAVKIVNMFVPKGVVLVTTRGKIARATAEYRTEQEPLDTLMPLAVLVDGGTASASEITAGSLQDLDRAVIVGTRTYGKGLVQRAVDLQHNGQLKLTIAKYYIPSGRCVQAINYRHSGGGSREVIPDSLTHEFRTRGGRPVRDGAGITPDVKAVADSLPNIAIYLCSGGMDSTEVVLHYVRDYIAAHDTIAAARDFHLTDADWAELRSRVVEAGFKYDQQTAKAYKELVEIAKFEGYYDDTTRAAFEALGAKLTHNLADDLDRNRAVICRYVEQDIIEAYHFQRGAAIAALPYDKQLLTAVAQLKTFSFKDNSRQ